MCKASRINFAVMCSANVDMAMAELYATRAITKQVTYKDGGYFKINETERKLVDDRAEEICLSTRFLSLSSN